MRVTIKVTKAMIAKGERHECYQCPVALALRAALLPSWLAEVTMTNIRIENSIGRKVYLTSVPLRIQGFISSFDGSRPVNPIAFSSNIPKKYLKPSVAKGAGK